MKPQIVSFLLKRKGWIFGLVLLTSVVIFIGRNTIGKSQQAVEYQTSTVMRGKIVSTVVASGQVVPANRLGITTEATGQVKQVFVKDGDTLALGQPVIELTPDRSGLQKSAQAWSAYLSAQTALASAQATAYSLQSTMYTKWKTYTDLATNSTYQNPDGSPNTSNRTLPQFTTTQDDWLAAEAHYKNQQNVTAQAEAAVNSNWLAYQAVAPMVTAPLAGTVSDLTVTPGMIFTTSGQQVASIVTAAAPVVSVNVAEIDAVRVRSGQKATVTADALPGKTFAATVVGINRGGVVSSGVTNYPATIALVGPTDELLPNMSVNADIVAATKDDVLLVPSAAVQLRAERSVVRVLKNRQVQQVTVETGLTSDTLTEIVSGLTEGEAVITGVKNSSSGQSGSPFSTFRFGSFGAGGTSLRSVGTGTRHD